MNIATDITAQSTLLDEIVTIRDQADRSAQQGGGEEKRFVMLLAEATGRCIKSGLTQGHIDDHIDAVSYDDEPDICWEFDA